MQRLAVQDPLRREPRVFGEMCVDTKVLCPVIQQNRVLFQIPAAEMWIQHFSDPIDIKSSQIPGLDNVLNQQIFVRLPHSDNLFQATWKKEMYVISKNGEVTLCPGVLAPLTKERMSNVGTRAWDGQEKPLRWLLKQNRGLSRGGEKRV